jgi:hypothetical protein
MTPGMALALTVGQRNDRAVEPRLRAVLLAMAGAALLVFATRWPVARALPIESDEFGFLEQATAHWFPMHHTLFMTFGRLLGLACGNPYRGFIVLDMLTSAGGLVSVWWLLRALVAPSIATAATVMLGAGPLFWGYGAVAGNYTAIVLVGAFLLGVAFRGQSNPRPWHPFAAALVLALGTGYRPDIGTLWLAVFVVILWQHRWQRAAWAGLLFTAINLAWLSAMLNDAGGWSHYRALSAEYAYQCGYRNSIWYLGLVDAPVRYSVKLGMALVWTLGPALVLVPAGLARLRRLQNGPFLLALMAVAAVPALGSHLLVHFGSPGWCFHYIPTLIALAALGAGRAGVDNFAAGSGPGLPERRAFRSAPALLLAFATVLAATFWFYPTDFDRPGWRGSFDLSFCRFTRVGINLPVLGRPQRYWRTAHSRSPVESPLQRPVEAPAGAG